MKCQWPGDGMAEGMQAAFRLDQRRPVAAKTTPEVPTVSAMIPGSTAPTPTACAAWSPPPPTTGIAGFQPGSAARPAVDSTR